jgi:hypothetical protein
MRWDFASRWFKRQLKLVLGEIATRCAGALPSFGKPAKHIKADAVFPRLSIFGKFCIRIIPHERDYIAPERGNIFEDHQTGICRKDALPFIKKWCDNRDQALIFDVINDV